MTASLSYAKFRRSALAVGARIPMRDDSHHRHHRSVFEFHKTFNEERAKHNADRAFRNLTVAHDESLRDGSASTVPLDKVTKESLKDPEILNRDDAFKLAKEAFYDIFQETLKRSDKTVEEVAFKAGVSEHTVRALLERRCLPTRATIEKIAAVFGKTAADFFDKDD